MRVPQIVHVPAKVLRSKEVGKHWSRFYTCITIIACWVQNKDYNIIKIININ